MTMIAAPKRNLPLKSYPMEPDLIDGLAELSAREHVPVAALVRRAIRRELEREGVFAPKTGAALKKGGKARAKR